ncbi:tetratricopeptide repeat protein [Superficieibacter sp.]|uniref:tetratricopeptide repeat protein n=1 Tax=Superficieibacter sp. TaxID=2303322 RepID=UPI0028A7157F|nr:tetratricopeptide repeat protein [Superficieibacter sp.]
MLPIRSALCALLVMSFAAHAEISEEEVNAACAKVPDYARDGEQAYKAKNYAKAYNAFAKQVIWSESCDLGDSAIATAYNNVALTLIRQKNYREAQAWLMLMPKDPKSAYNLGMIKDKLAALPPATSPAGEYWQYAGGSAWNTLTLKAGKSAGEYQADYMGYYFGIMGAWNGPNTGEFSAPVRLKDGKGVIAVRDGAIANCDIALTVAPDEAELKTDQPQECGFGHNVDANGTFVRVK